MSDAEASLKWLEELLAKATPGPWRVAENEWNLKARPWRQTGGIEADLDLEVPAILGWFTRPSDQYNAALIVAAVNALPGLIRDYRAQAALLEEAEAKLKANEWELADYAKTVANLRDDSDVVTCPSCGYESRHVERFR